MGSILGANDFIYERLVVTGSRHARPESNGSGWPRTYQTDGAKEKKFSLAFDCVQLMVLMCVEMCCSRIWWGSLLGGEEMWRCGLITTPTDSIGNRSHIRSNLLRRLQSIGSSRKLSILTCSEIFNYSLRMDCPFLDTNRA
jgi:hypothetical protein